MKKIIIVLCLVLLLAIPVSAEPDVAAPFTGDVNGDGKITATDARLTLRMATKLDKYTEADVLVADANGDGKISATDARLVLRVGARLSKLSVGFDKDGKLNAVNVLEGGKYSIIATTEEGSVTIIKNGNDYYMCGIDMDGMEMPVELQDMGFLIKDGKFYITWTTKESGSRALLDPTLLMDDLDPSEFIGDINGLIGQLVPSEVGEPTLANIDGTDYLRFPAKIGGSSAILITTVGGKLVSLDDGFAVSEFTDLTADIPLEVFDLNNYIV